MKVKKTKKAKSSIRFVDAEMWLKKQKWSYEPGLQCRDQLGVPVGG